MTTVLRNLAKPYIFLLKEGGLSVVIGLVLSALVYSIYFGLNLLNLMKTISSYILDFQNPMVFILKLVGFFLFFGIAHLLLTKTFLKFLNNSFFNYLSFLFLTYVLYIVNPLVCYIFVGIGLLLLLFKYLIKGGDFVYDISGSPFGDSRWSTSKELSENGLDEDDFLLGRDAKTNMTIGFKGEGHVLTVAKTGAGKGVGIVIPNLLNYSGSIITIDPKGENFLRTVYARSMKFPEQEIALIDPFGEVPKQIDQKLNLLTRVENKTSTHNELISFYKNLKSKVNDSTSEGTYLRGINPLKLIEDFISRKQYGEVFDQANTIADMIVVKDKNDSDPYWNDKAKMLIKNTIIYLAYFRNEEYPLNLPMVKQQILDFFDTYTNEDGQEIRLIDHTIAYLEYLKETNEQENFVDERISVLKEIAIMDSESVNTLVSVAFRHLAFVDSPYVVRNLSDNQLNLSNIKDKELSIYLVMPANKLSSYNRLIRLWIASLVDAIAMDIRLPKKRILFMLDEMAQLGYMEPLVQAVSLLRGYGLNMWMIFQDISQLKSIYGNKWKTFSSNAKIQQFFGVSDDETATYVSKLSGMTTVYSRGETFNNDGGLFGENSQHSYTASGRQLLYPDQLFRTKLQFIFIDEMFPVKARKIRFYNDGYFSKANKDFPVSINQVEKNLF
ncbi:MAG: type IV secretory system conjugative DNA transfer family protein [Bacteroidota bacterium]